MGAMNVGGLDVECPRCGLVMGEHTVRQWVECSGRPHTELPYMDVPEDAAAMVNARLHEMFSIDSDVVCADTITSKSLVLSGQLGGVTMHMPCVLHEFQVGIVGQRPGMVAKVLYMGTPDAIRTYGRLIRDTANGAANAATRLP